MYVDHTSSIVLALCPFIDADYSMIPLSMNSENAPVNYDDDDGPVDMGGVDESRLVSTKNAL